jgi:RHS repeat-associated protein
MTTYYFIYGPDDLPIEQISNTTGAVLYLHHDQQGSTRLLTGSTGKVEGKCSYSAYGVPTCEGSATTPLGYDAQYTSPDTGLVYLRARTYDPATAQFLSVDPIASLTRAPYSYADDNPLNYYDPTGLSGIFGTGIGPNVGPDIRLIYMRARVYDPTTAQFLTVDPAVALTREPYAYGGDNPVNRRDPDGLSAEGIEGVPCYFPFSGPTAASSRRSPARPRKRLERDQRNEGSNDEGEAAPEPTQPLHPV